MSDAELAERVHRHDPQACDDFISRYHAGVYRYMVGLTGRSEDAEDLAIQTMARAVEKIRKFNGRSSLKTWVHGIAYHQFTHWHRRRRFELTLDANQVAQDAAFEAIDAVADLRSALSRLPTELRQAFVMHEINELSVDDIALIEQIPVGTVKSRLHAARLRLRELISPQEEANDVQPVMESR